jgi:quinol monooxygenase YgiN
MSVARIGQFRAQEGQEEALLAFLTTVVAPAIRGAAGNESAAVFQSLADPTVFTVIEVWADVAAHRASVQHIPPEMIQQVMPLLAAPPTGDYYQPC